jgi:hypothetical protein
VTCELIAQDPGSVLEPQNEMKLSTYLGSLPGPSKEAHETGESVQDYTRECPVLLLGGVVLGVDIGDSQHKHICTICSWHVSLAPVGQACLSMSIKHLQRPQLWRSFLEGTCP